MYHALFTTASTTAAVGTIYTVFGANIGPVLIVLGLAIGIPLTFYVIDEIKKVFEARRTHRLSQEFTREVVAGLGPENVFIQGKSVAEMRDEAEAGVE